MTTIDPYEIPRALAERLFGHKRAGAAWWPASLLFTIYSCETTGEWRCWWYYTTDRGITAKRVGHSRADDLVRLSITNWLDREHGQVVETGTDLDKLLDIVEAGP